MLARRNNIPSFPFNWGLLSVSLSSDSWSHESKKKGTGRICSEHANKVPIFIGHTLLSETATTHTCKRHCQKSNCNQRGYSKSHTTENNYLVTKTCPLCKWLHALLYLLIACVVPSTIPLLYGGKADAKIARREKQRHASKWTKWDIVRQVYIWKTSRTLTCQEFTKGTKKWAGSFIRTVQVGKQALKEGRANTSHDWVVLNPSCQRWAAAELHRFPLGHMTLIWPLRWAQFHHWEVAKCSASSRMEKILKSCARCHYAQYHKNNFHIFVTYFSSTATFPCMLCAHFLSVLTFTTDSVTCVRLPCLTQLFSQCLLAITILSPIPSFIHLWIMRVGGISLYK